MAADHFTNFYNIQNGNAIENLFVVDIQQLSSIVINVMLLYFSLVFMIKLFGQCADFQ